jgi:CheY-like chemotaxis protein
LPERLRWEKFDLLLVDSMIHPKSLNADNQEVENIHFANVNWQRTGQEFLLRLRRGDFCSETGSGTSPHVPIIVLSAVADSWHEMTGDPARQITKYIEKPFDPEELAETIHQLLKD